MLLATNDNLELHTDDGERGYVFDTATQQKYPEMSVATIITRGNWIMVDDTVEKGGEGSGFHGHAGRPGEVGGSSSSRNPKEETLHEYLKQVSSISDKSAEHVVLQHGKYYNPQPLPKGYKRGRPKECYVNAYRLSQREGLTYVEGFAMPDFMDLPVQHAWVVDKDGNVIDNTWPKPGTAYIGIPFDDMFVASVLSETGTYGVISYHSKAFRDKYYKEATIVLKGGAGSGFEGHAGIPGHRGGSLPRGAAKFNQDEWEKMDMSQRRDAWGKLSVTDRDRLADAAHSIKGRQEQVLGFAGERPAFTGDVSKAIDERTNAFKDFIPDVALDRVNNISKELDKYLTDAGTDPEVRYKLAMEVVDSLVTQDSEAIGRTLGDHGIYHIGGNIRYSLDMMEAVPGYDSSADKAEVIIAGVFHDSGYLTAPSRIFLDEGHPRWSQQHFDKNIRPLVEDALGSAAAGDVSHVIRTHDTTDLNWQEDTVGSAFRTSDNIALFHEEKLPGMFRYVPDNIVVLEQLAKGELDLATARSRMVDNVSNSNYSSAVKDRMLHAAREVVPVTPKFTLGMLGGEISGVKWSTDHIKVLLHKSKETERLNKIMEIGQRQFKKLAETYNQDVADFSKTGKFLFKNNKGTSVLEAETIDISTVAKEDYSTSVIVAFSFEDDTELEALRDDVIMNEADRTDDLHLTLLYLGDTSIDKQLAVEVMNDIAMTHSPISGAFNGFAILDTPNDDGKLPVVLLFDSPLLTGFYVVTKAMFRNRGIEPSGDHGFTAHVTLGYVSSTLDEEVVKENVSFGRILKSICLWYGDEHIEFPLTGTVTYKQLPISGASKDALISIRRDMFYDETNALAEKVFTGNLSIGDWEERMKQMIRELHASTAAIGKGGWDAMTSKDWGRLGPVMKSQYRYLHGFAEYIEANKDTVSLNAIQARARMYGNAGGYSSILVEAGSEFASKLPWLPKDGSTDCLVNCKCFWELKVMDTIKRNRGKLNNKVVQATWRLRPAEHCDTCLDRNGKVFMIEVHESVDVPERIG